MTYELATEPLTPLPARLLTAEEAAGVLNVSAAQVYRMIQRGELPAVRMGRLVRVRPETLQRFVEQVEQGGVEAATARGPHPFAIRR